MSSRTDSQNNTDGKNERLQSLPTAIPDEPKFGHYIVNARENAGD
jgi:hypothetical protein